jgi:hypothetical protein
VVSTASVGTDALTRPPGHNPGDGFFMRHLAAPRAKAAFRRHHVHHMLDVLDRPETVRRVIGIAC